MEIRLRNWRDFDCPDRIAQWDAVAEWAAEPNPFYESWYLLPSLRALDPEGEVKLLCMSANGQLAGLMPVVRNASYYGRPLPHLANWVHANCFIGAPLVARGCEREFWRKLLAWSDRKCGTALFLHLAEMPLAGRMQEALEDVLEEGPRPFGIVMREDRPMLASPLSTDDYLEEFCSAKRRKELRRQRGKLEEHGKVEFRWH